MRHNEFEISGVNLILPNEIQSWISDRNMSLYCVTDESVMIRSI